MSLELDTINISSFSAPTAEDIAYFKSLPDAEQENLVLAEIEKSSDSKTVPASKTLSMDIFGRALKRVNGDNAAR